MGNGVEIVCVEGITVRASITVDECEVVKSLAELNRAAAPGLEWRRPITYSDDREVCQACAQLHCACPATRSALRGERFTQGFSR